MTGSSGMLRSGLPSLRLRAERYWLASVAALLAALLAGCLSLPGVLQREPQLELVFIGQQVLPPGYRYADTTVGGLSGIDYDAATGRYWAISDDHSEHGPSRFYELALDLSQFNKTADPGYAGVTFNGVQTLKRLDGSTFADARTNPDKPPTRKRFACMRPAGGWCGPAKASGSSRLASRRCSSIRTCGKCSGTARSCVRS